MNAPGPMPRWSSANAAPPHAGQPIDAVGPPPESGRRAAILLHGRGGAAHELLTVIAPIGLSAWSVLAPQASGHSWYPRSFLVPRADNQPGLDSVHSVLESLVTALASAGVPRTAIALIGFSQGACVALDHACRFPARYGAIVAFTGGLIGSGTEPFADVRASDGDAGLNGTPIYLGSGDPDMHVPWERVEASASHLRSLGATITLERFPGAPHTILPQQVLTARRMLEAMTSA